MSKADEPKGISLYSEHNSLLMSSGRPLTQRGANFETSFLIHTLCTGMYVYVCGVRVQPQLLRHRYLGFLLLF